MGSQTSTSCAVLILRCGNLGKNDASGSDLDEDLRWKGKEASDHAFSVLGFAEERFFTSSGDGGKRAQPLFSSFLPQSAIHVAEDATGSRSKKLRRDMKSVQEKRAADGRGEH